MAYNLSSGLSSWALPRAQWIHFDNDSLIQPDLPARAKAYKDLIGSEVLTPEEARVFENWAPHGTEEAALAVLASTTDGGT
jgi:hypothetical protein